MSASFKDLSNKGSHIPSSALISLKVKKLKVKKSKMIFFMFWCLKYRKVKMQKNMKFA
jgi:hypothetical protein